MTDLTELYKRLTLVLFASCAFTAGACGTDSPTVQVPGDGGGGDPPPDTGGQAPPPPTAVFSVRASRSSTIAISDDDTHVAMVNPDDGSLSVFQTSDNSRISKVLTGPNPSSVVIAGDGSTAYVANRGDGTVTRVINIDGGTPKADFRVDVGAEPVGLALSPSGLKLFVAEFAEGRISVLDTQNDLAIIDTIAFDRPRALVVTNNADQSDDDEILIASHYYGTPVAGKEGKDDGRTGLVVTWPLTSLHTATKITLASIDSGFPKGGVAGAATVTTSPNQLASMAVAGTRVYVTSVSASPEGQTRFDNNVFPVVYVADWSSGTEVRDGSGTANLARKIVDKITAAPGAPRFIPGDLSDIAFIEGSRVAYAIGKAGDVMLRMDYSGATMSIGSTVGKPQEINLGTASVDGTACQEPIGLIVSGTLKRAYVNCWVTRRLGLVDLDSQTLTQTFEAAPAPASAADKSILNGKRFFFTGRARWSNAGANGAAGGEGWSSCGSCHPDGLSDNITWIFPAGPRQTTSMDGTFSHGPGPQKQRALNWTSVNDELHDFEANVRNVSGGLGAITLANTALNPVDCATLDKELPVTANVALGLSNKSLADNTAIATCKRKDWDDITNYVETIVPVHALKFSDSASVERGKALFVSGNCNQCHGGSGWTVSSRPYDPTQPTQSDGTGTGATDFGAQLLSIPSALAGFMHNADATGTKRKQISEQPAIGAVAGVPVLQIACSLRDVATFGVPSANPGTPADDAAAKAATDALEVRGAGAPAIAEGFAGYNVPSLYGLAVGAPYLHHGQAATLADLFTDPRWINHTEAGSTNFSLTLANADKLADLIAFLRSIDASTGEIALPSGFDACHP
jgi:DNA-binding beta-propeller fold protein YncE